MGLFDGLNEQYAAPEIQNSEPVYVITLKRASNGDEILLCNVTPPPAAAIQEAKSMKLPLFTYAEIPALRQAAAEDPKYIDNLIAARRVMGWGGMITFQVTT